MRKIKVILALTLAVIFCLSSCGQIINPVDTGTNSSTDTDISTDTPSAGGGTFSVSLKLDGKPYIPEEEDIMVEWTKEDGHGVHTAPLKDGYAEVEGLDGNYRVSLSKFPKGYVYNPNNQFATNDSKHLEIELIEPVEIKVIAENDIYHGLNIKQDGVYSVTLESANQIVYYQYLPMLIGSYSVESWVNAEENKINPKLDYYSGTTAAKYYQFTINDGGDESYYTKNFKCSDNVTAVGQCLSFGIKATSKDGEYPISVVFAVYRDGDAPGSSNTTEMRLPSENLTHQAGGSSDGSTVVSGAETIQNGHRVFKNKMWELWKKEDGGDGYYHLYDLEKYPETNGYGPILYAYIDVPTRFIGSAFTTIESAGNNALTIYLKTDSGVNKISYKMAIQGLPSLVVDQTKIDPNMSAPYMCGNNCPCYLNMEDAQPLYKANNIQYVGACPKQCNKCLETCNHISDDTFNLLVEAGKPGSSIQTVTVCRYDCMDCAVRGSGCYGGCICECENKLQMPQQLLGYQYFTNNDGGYAVTEEIKTFLQAFSIQQRLFADGDGLVETHDITPVNAAEDSQWLFACYYYKEKQ